MLRFKISEVEDTGEIMDPWQLRETSHISQDASICEHQEQNSASSRKKRTVLVVYCDVTTPNLGDFEQRLF